MTFEDLEKGDEFRFYNAEDIYVFGGLDGKFAIVFDTVAEYKANHRPAYVGAYTYIRGPKDEKKR